MRAKQTWNCGYSPCSKADDMWNFEGMSLLRVITLIFLAPGFYRLSDSEFPTWDSPVAIHCRANSTT